MGDPVTIAFVASSLAGVASTVHSYRESKKAGKAPVQVGNPDAPKVEDSAEAARQDVLKRRRAMKQTDLTRGSALVPEINVGQKSLLGQ